MEVLDQLISSLDLDRSIALFFLVAARWAPLVMLAPFLGAKAMPVSARIGLAAGLAVLVFPAASRAAGPLPSEDLIVGLLLVRELAVGVLLGLLVAVPFYGLEAGGRLVDTARGARMAEVLATPTEVRASPTGALLLLAGVVLFLSVDGHLLVVQAAADSYRVLPVGAGLSPGAPARLVPMVIHLGSHLFLVALGLAAPVIAATVLVDLALGLAGRVAPQLQLYFLGLPVKALGGVAVLLLTLAAMTATLGAVFRFVLRTMERAVAVLGG